MTEIGPLHRYTAPSRTLLWSEYLRASAETAAYLAPEKVRCVNTLGSPFRLGVDDAPDSTYAGRIFHAFKPWHTEFLAHRGNEQDRAELTVPATSIFSRLYGIVSWEAWQDLTGPLRENVEVTPSLLGMGVYPHVLEIVLDRLRQPLGAWQRYDARVAA